MEIGQWGRNLTQRTKHSIERCVLTMVMCFVFAHSHFFDGETNKLETQIPSPGCTSEAFLSLSLPNSTQMADTRLMPSGAPAFEQGIAGFAN